MLQMMVPSGRLPMGRMLPITREAAQRAQQDAEYMLQFTPARGPVPTATAVLSAALLPLAAARVCCTRSSSTCAQQLGIGGAGQERTLLAAVQKLSGVGALGRDKPFLVDLVLVRVAETCDCNRRTTARLVDDILDHALDVAVAFSKVEHSQLAWPLTQARVGREDSLLALALTTNDPPHSREVRE